MKLTDVELYSPDFSEVISFSLRHTSPQEHYSVRSILGLDAEEITPRFYGYGLNSGSKFYDFVLKPRDVVMRVALHPQFEIGENYSDVRDKLYRSISATRTGLVSLHFKSGSSVVSKLEGYFKKVEVGYFNKLPEVQITIHCNYPIFRSIGGVHLMGDVDEEIHYDGGAFVLADSISTAPHGLVLVGNFVTDQASIAFQDALDPEWIFEVTPEDGFETGDQLFISSEYTNKYVYIIRDAVQIHLLDAVSPTSIWPIIFPGINNYYCELINTSDFTIEYVEFYGAYWGV